MNEERRMVLQLLEEGKITAEEAAELLRALAEAQPEGGRAGASDVRSEGARIFRRDPIDIASWAEAFAERMSERGEKLAELVSEHGERIAERVSRQVSEHPFAFSLFGPTAEDETEWTHPLREDGRLHLDVSTNNGRVEVRGAARDDVLVRLRRAAQAPTRAQAEAKLKDVGRVEWRDGTLVVEPGAMSGGWMLWGGTRLRALVEVPRGALVTGRVRSHNGRITLESLQLPEDGRLEARTSNGRVEALRVSGGSLLISTRNGRLDLDEVDSSLDAHTTNGSVEWLAVRAARDRDVRLATLNGSIRMVLPARSGLSVTAETFAGSIHNRIAGFQVEGRHARRSLRGERAGEPMIRVTASTRNGSIRVEETGEAGGEVEARAEGE